MLRVAARRLSSLSSGSPWKPNQIQAQAQAQAVSSLISHNTFNADGRDSSLSDYPRSNPMFHFPVRGFASDLTTSKHENSVFPEVPPTVAVIRNPSSKIVYDEHNHERFPPGDPSKRSFAYFVLTGGRFVYASSIRLLVLKFLLSMSASKDVLSLASLEVDISSIEPGSTVTVKCRGKPVFIRRRTEDDIKLANSVDDGSLRGPQNDSERGIVVTVCTYLGCFLIWEWVRTLQFDPEKWEDFSPKDYV